MNDEKKKIRPVYSELQGYLNQAPGVGEHGSSTTRDETLWKQLNSTIDELNVVSDLNFDKFKVTGIKNGQSYYYINVSEYRTKLGGLITRLHGTYFSDEPAPFYGMPSTTITVSNQQEQSQHQTMLVELHSVIDKKLASLPEGKEKSFLGSLKEGLGTVKDFASLMMLISTLGQKYGIGMEQLASLLGH
ncbi:MAG: hypothetical protein WDZ88_00550 [Candidatus Paceibacterota bacterium]